MKNSAFSSANSENYLAQKYAVVRVKIQKIQFDGDSAYVVELENADDCVKAIRNQQKYDNLVKMTQQLDKLY